MITTAEEYYSHLFQIQDHNAPSLALLLPRDEIIYNIDLNTRKIEAPDVLSAQYDHYAETIYFSVDRYFDNMDLTNTVCVVQFINEKNEEEGHLYVVPFYDITYFLINFFKFVVDKLCLRLYNYSIRCFFTKIFRRFTNGLNSKRFNFCRL